MTPNPSARSRIGVWRIPQAFLGGVPADTNADKPDDGSSACSRARFPSRDNRHLRPGPKPCYDSDSRPVAIWRGYWRERRRQLEWRRRPLWSTASTGAAAPLPPFFSHALAAFLSHVLCFLGCFFRLVSTSSFASFTFFCDRASVNANTRRYNICFIVKLHYVIVLCGAERVKTISHESLQCLCFERRSQSRSLAEDAGSTIGTFGYDAPRRRPAGAVSPAGCARG